MFFGCRLRLLHNMDNHQITHGPSYHSPFCRSEQQNWRNLSDDTLSFLSSKSSCWRRFFNNDEHSFLYFSDKNGKCCDTRFIPYIYISLAFRPVIYGNTNPGPQCSQFSEYGLPLVLHFTRLSSEYESSFPCEGVAMQITQR